MIKWRSQSPDGGRFFFGFSFFIFGRKSRVFCHYP
jgi:hypothetical protein